MQIIIQKINTEHDVQKVEFKRLFCGTKDLTENSELGCRRSDVFIVNLEPTC